MIKRRDSHWFLILTLLAGISLMLIPMPEWAQAARPYWVALLLIYWSLEGRFTLSLGGAFLVGLVLDISLASLLGQHALSLLILIYLVERFRTRLRFFPIWQQTLAILGLLLNDRFILLWIILLEGTESLSWTFWLSPFVGALMWPWLFLLLDRARRFGRSRPV